MTWKHSREEKREDNLTAEEVATFAFEAHKALLVHESAHPYLKRNPAWLALRSAAFNRHKRTLEAMR
jgi:hypothetical protein